MATETAHQTIERLQQYLLEHDTTSEEYLAIRLEALHAQQREAREARDAAQH